MQDVFAKARPRKAIFKRTRPRAELPQLVLYLEWLSGEFKRRVKDTAGNEHLLTDKTMQSYYRMVTGSKAKELGERHWPGETASPKPATNGAASPTGKADGA